ncbi:MAG: heme ABC exporter ATP-binding protein CcmA [Alphaproteobacteria bacterium]|nr:heme ABC exporter ATP-binding protein CcmA [Alphaproteobacteria bacterium]
MKLIAAVNMRKISLQNLSCHRGGYPILKNICLDIEPGQTLRVIGPNGCGKSTFLKTVVGLLESPGKTIRYGDQRIHNDDFIFLDHLPLMKNNLTTQENLNFWSGIYHSSALDLTNAMQVFGLHTLLHTPFHALSCGQQKRLQLALILLKKSPIWILDEPLAGLDTHYQQRLATMVKTHNDHQGIVLYASHDPIPGIRDCTIEIHPFQPQVYTDDLDDFAAA